MMQFELGTLTGEVEDAHVEVETLMSVKRMCKPMFAFPVIAHASKNWVEKYKDKFQALIAYENGNKEKAIMLGLVPIGKGDVLPEEGLEDNVYMISEKFRTWMNDKDNQYVIDTLDDGEILLGNKDVTEHAVLGDIMQKWLEDYIDKHKEIVAKCKDMNTSISQLTVNTAVGPSSPPVNIADFAQFIADFALFSTDLDTLKSRLPDLLSQKVKLL